MIAGTAIGATKAGGSKQDEREERGGGDSSISARTGQGERVDAMEEDGREATGRGIEEGGMGATEGWVEEVDGVRGVQGAGGEAEASTKEAVVAAVGSGCSSRSMAGPQVCVCVFDMLYLNGQSLVKKSLRERREEESGSGAVEASLGAAIERGCEGLMVKLLDGPPSFYFPNKRSDSWLKKIAAGRPPSFYCPSKRSDSWLKLLDGPPSFYCPNKRSDSWLKVGTGTWTHGLFEVCLTEVSL
ncbi:unnamed protein product [Closterium sp. NIES-64]|nr:unnamed protein product [Closterium sp. NIES-64]